MPEHNAFKEFYKIILYSCYHL